MLDGHDKAVFNGGDDRLSVQQWYSLSITLETRSWRGCEVEDLRGRCGRPTMLERRDHHLGEKEGPMAYFRQETEPLCSVCCSSFFVSRSGPPGPGVDEIFGSGPKSDAAQARS